jgi:hypothetical protein
MRSYHRVALAVMAWYLMYPPWNTEKQAIDPTLPFTEWYQVGTFPSDTECRARRFEILKGMDSQIAHSDNTNEDEERRLRDDARCIAEDDSRLQPRQAPKTE